MIMGPINENSFKIAIRTRKEVCYVMKNQI